jgi:hypothetical protein
MARPFGTFKYRTKEALEAAINEYFNKCDGEPLRDENGYLVLDKHGNPMYKTIPEPYTLEGLALHLGVTPQTLCNYAKNEDYFESIEYARMKCLQYAAKRLYDKDGVQGAKFYAINNSKRMGGLEYSEKVEHDITMAPVMFVDDLKD